MKHADHVHCVHFCRLALVFWLLLPAAVPAHASTNAVLQYSSRTWQTDEGLPQNAVQAVTKTRDGYLWVGTLRGLARFDGVRFTVFDPQNTPALKGATITALYPGRDGSLWIGTGGGGLTLLQNGHFTHH